MNADLVYYHHDTADKKLWTWVVPRTGGLDDIHFVEQENIGEDDIPQIVSAMDEATVATVAMRAHQGSHGAAAVSVATDLSRLYELLIAPIADKLSPDGRVVFFPHGSFVLTPFSALRCSAEGQAPQQPQFEPEPEMEPEPAKTNEPLDMDFAEWLALHNASQYEAAFREELEGSGTLADILSVVQRSSTSAIWLV